MQIHYFYLIFTIFFLFKLAYSLKFLIIAPDTWYSHLVFHGRLADVLVEAGHYVHLLIPIGNDKTRFNDSTLAQKVTRYQLTEENFEKMTNTINSMPYLDPDYFWSNKVLWSRIDRNLQKNIRLFNFMDLMHDIKFLNELRAENFDAGMAEGWEMLPFAIFHMLGIKTTFVTLPVSIFHVLAYQIGLPQPIYVPELSTSPIEGPNMGIWERMRNVYEVWYNQGLYEGIYEEYDEYLKQLNGPDFPTINELIYRKSYLFININQILDIAKPISAKVKYIGGIALKPQSNPSLDERTRSIFNWRLMTDDAYKGVIIFSFGSLVDVAYMPVEKRDAFLNTFRKFTDYEFIWQLSGDRSSFDHLMKDTSFYDSMIEPNIHLFEWVDMPSILAHPRTKVFITHCGLNSMMEAIEFGIPMLGIPLMGDQYYNAAVINTKWLGLIVDKSNITERSITSALEILLSNRTYAQNVRNMKRKLDLAPFKPREVFLKHVEFATQFDDHMEELSLYGAKMTFFSYFGLDFILPILFLILIILLMVIWSVVKFISYFVYSFHFHF